MTTLRQRLQSAPPLLGCFVMYPSPGAIERIGPDWDFFWLDGQHGELGYAELLGLVRACDVAGTPAIVRVPSHERGFIGKALDMGAAGILVPQVESAEEARAVVAAAKFPPLGNRSYGGRRVIDLHGRGYSDTANDDTLVIVQLESPQALERIDEIAAVPGVDGLNIGPDDVRLRQGGGMTDPRTVDETRRFLEILCGAARRHGKLAAAIGKPPEVQTLCVEMGVHMLIHDSDVGLLAAASQQASRAARALIAGRRAKAPAPADASPSPY